MTLNKQFTKGLFFVGLCAAATSSFAGSSLPEPSPRLRPLPNWYTTAFVGAAQLHRFSDAANNLIYFKTSFDVGGSVGLRYGPVRMEAQYTYIDSPVRNVTSQVTGDSLQSLGINFEARQRTNAALANVYFDVQPCALIGLYGGAGVGYARFNQNASGSAVLSDGSVLIWHAEDVQNKVAYQGMVGATINTDNQFYFDIGYRYLTARKLDFNNTRPVFYLLSLGLTYHIPA